MLFRSQQVKLSNDRFLPDPLQFIIHYYQINRRHTI
jgi:hypothetical protein